MNLIIEKVDVLKSIIEILLNNMGEDGISRISQQEIANQIGKSPSSISKTLRKLEQYDKCIEKIAPAVYRVNQKDIINHGPIFRVLKYGKILEENPEVMLKPLAEQSEFTDMSIEEIKMAQGYLYGAFGTPHKNKT